MIKDDSITSHFKELRTRIIKSFLLFSISLVVLLPFNKLIFEFFSTFVSRTIEQNLIAIEVASPFFVPLKLVFFIAFLLTFPYLIFQVLSFMSPGLYKQERKIIFSRTVLGSILFYLGVIFCISVVLPNVFYFFQNIGPENLAITTDIGKFYNFSLNLMIAFGLTFQIPLLINAIISFGLITKNELREYRGIFLIICFFVGMILTPPDIISQIFLAVPMYILFELGLAFTNEKKT